MTDNEMLLAISVMLDPMKEGLQGVRKDIQEIKEDLRGVKQDLRGVKQDIQEIKNRVKTIELTQENVILPRLNTIESCYTSTCARYKDHVETYESMKQDVSVIKQVVAEHSERLQKIS